MSDNHFLSPTRVAGKQVVSRTRLCLSLMGRRWRNAPHGGMRCAFPPYTLYSALLAFCAHGESSCCEIRNRGARRAPRRVGLTSSISPTFLRPQRNRTFCEATLLGSV